VHFYNFIIIIVNTTQSVNGAKLTPGHTYKRRRDCKNTKAQTRRIQKVNEHIACRSNLKCFLTVVTQVEDITSSGREFHIGIIRLLKTHLKGTCFSWYFGLKVKLWYFELNLHTGVYASACVEKNLVV